MTSQPSAEEVYAQAVKPLSASERLKLATMILNDISPLSVVEYSDEWSEEDMCDFAAASWRYALQQVEVEEDAEAG
jgi:hypothetical protein